MLRSLAFFETRQRIEPDWIIPGWLKRRNTGFILGQPKKACKSWLMLNQAWELSEGRPLWNIKKARGEYLFEPPRSMRIVYFTQEDTEDDLHDRILLLLSSGQKANGNLYFVPKDLSLTLDEKGRARILMHLDQAAQDGPLDLIMFDPMRRLHTGKENESDTMVQIWQTLDTIHQRYNCATQFSHHLVKPKEGSDPTSPNAARGSGDIYGGGDAFFNVVPANSHGRTRSKRLLDIHTETKRSRAVSPFRLAMNFDTGIVTFEGFLVGTDAAKSSSDTKDELSEMESL